MVKLKLVQVKLGKGKLSSAPPRQQLVEKLLPPREKLASLHKLASSKLLVVRQRCAVVSSKLKAGLLKVLHSSCASSVGTAGLSSSASSVLEVRVSSSESSILKGCLGSCESSVVEAVRGKLLFAKLSSWKVLALKLLSWKLSSRESSVVKVGL